MWIDGYLDVFEYWVKCGTGLSAVLASALRWGQTEFMKAMSEDQIMQVMLDAFVKTEASAVSSATASLIASDKGVLCVERKSSLAINVKQQIICGAPAMDSDIPKVFIFHVNETGQIFFLDPM